MSKLFLPGYQFLGSTGAPVDSGTVTFYETGTTTLKAIYTNTAAGFLNRLYSPANMEDRLDRFGTHALHIVRALQDVAAAGHDDTIICKHIIQWRQHLNQKVLTSTV